MSWTADQIEEVLPHRYPFALVDRIESLSEDGLAIIGRKCVSQNEMFFTGHFPGHKVMPGVLIVEALAQTGCFLLLSRPENHGRLAFFAGINRMRFRREVHPGDVLDLHVAFTRQKAGIYFASVRAECEGQTVCEGEIFCTLSHQEN